MEILNDISGKDLLMTDYKKLYSIEKINPVI